MNLDEEIVFVEKAEHDLYSIKILKGEFADVIYTYGKVQVVENDELDEATLKFNFIIHNVPDRYTIEKLENSSKFKNYIGDVLAELIEEKTRRNDESPNFNN